MGQFIKMKYANNVIEIVEFKDFLTAFILALIFPCSRV